MNRGERAVVARVHGLQHVQRLAATTLSNHDAIGTHPQRASHQIPDADIALALNVWRPGLETDNVPLREPQLRSVLNGENTFRLGQVSTQCIEQSRLACARTAVSATQLLETAVECLQQAKREGGNQIRAMQ